MNSLRILKDQDVNIYYDVAMMTSQKSDSENLVEPATRKEKKCRAQGRLKYARGKKIPWPLYYTWPTLENL